MNNIIEIIGTVAILAAFIMAFVAWQRLYKHLDAPGIKTVYFAFIGYLVLLIISAIGSALVGVYFVVYAMPAIAILKSLLYLFAAFGLMRLSKHFMILNLNKES